MSKLSTAWLEMPLMQKGRKLWGCGLLMAMLLIFAGPAHAATAWVTNEYAQSRLIFGGYDAATQKLYIGWHVKLAPGWKTYWRSPGEAGLPPRWIWQERGNVKTVEAHWPRPEKYSIFGLETYVYTDEVVIPLVLTVADQAAPTRLDLRVEYMVCENVCVPLEGHYRLMLPPITQQGAVVDEEVFLYDYFMQQVPKRLNPVPPSFEARAVGQGVLEVHLRGKTPDLTTAGLLLEGPEGIVFSSSEMASRAGDGLYFRIPYEINAPAVALRGQAVRVTFWDGRGAAVEQDVTVVP